MTLALHVSGPFRVFYTRLQSGCLCAAEVPLSQCWAGLTELTSHLLFWGCQPCWGSSSPGRAHLHAPSLPLPAVSTAEARYHPACSHLPLQSPPPPIFRIGTSSLHSLSSAGLWLFSWETAPQLGPGTSSWPRGGGLMGLCALLCSHSSGFVCAHIFFLPAPSLSLRVNCGDRGVSLQQMV